MLIREQIRDDVVQLQLDRPPVNALTGELLDQLRSRLNELGSARAVVICGREGIFSAGLDLPHLLSLDRDGMLAFWRSFYRALEALARCPVPLGVAITGHNPAGGTVLSLFADFRIAAEGDFKLGLNEVQVGLPMPALVYRAYERLLGPRLAARHAVSGTLFVPSAALAAGLVDELAPADRVIAHSMAWAQKLAQFPRAALDATRAVARAELIGLFDRVDDSAYEELNQAWFRPEVRGALEAFVAQILHPKENR